jgi:hypothetical protein
MESSAGDRRNRPADPQVAVPLGANLNCAGSPSELALVDQHGLAARTHAVVKQVTGG